MLWYNESHTLLMNCIKPCLNIYIRRKIITKATIILFDAILGHNHQVSLPKNGETTKYWGWLSAWQMGGWEARTTIHFIPSEVLQNLMGVCPYEKWDTSGLILHTIIGYAILIITTQNHNHIQMLDFSCTLVMKNDMIWYNESPSLLLTYLKSLLEGLM